MNANSSSDTNTLVLIVTRVFVLALILHFSCLWPIVTTPSNSLWQVYRWAYPPHLCSHIYALQLAEASYFHPFWVCVPATGVCLISCLPALSTPDWKYMSSPLPLLTLFSPKSHLVPDCSHHLTSFALLSLGTTPLTHKSRSRIRSQCRVVAAVSSATPLLSKYVPSYRTATLPLWLSTSRL